jgi:Bifunctional DNA primase/polymerase, N-terminal
MGALDEVLGLAAHGRRLFPCGPQTKTPLLKGWSTLASSDPASIQKWDVKYPGCNWGVPTGPGSVYSFLTWTARRAGSR